MNRWCAGKKIDGAMKHSFPIFIQAYNESKIEDEVIEDNLYVSSNLPSKLRARYKLL